MKPLSVKRCTAYYLVWPLEFKKVVRALRALEDARLYEVSPSFRLNQAEPNVGLLVAGKNETDAIANCHDLFNLINISLNEKELP